MDKSTHEMRLMKWTAIIKECRSSGKTVTAWCSENNISSKSFYYWQRKVRNTVLWKILKFRAIQNLYNFPPLLILGLLWEGDGFLLLYKRLETGKFQWPRNESEVKSISSQQFKWLMEGLAIEQKKAIKSYKPQRVL